MSIISAIYQYEASHFICYTILQTATVQIRHKDWGNRPQIQLHTSTEDFNND